MQQQHLSGLFEFRRKHYHSTTIFSPTLSPNISDIEIPTNSILSKFGSPRIAIKVESGWPCCSSNIPNVLWPPTSIETDSSRGTPCNFVSSMSETRPPVALIETMEPSILLANLFLLFPQFCRLISVNVKRVSW